MAKFTILLLTNRDSDNVGDQIIEASVISILKAIMANLGVPESGYRINSRAAGIISRKYMSTGDPALLKDARRAISAADVVVFGGAPLFNYAYQSFYRRTIKTVELAQEYGVPVLFSSIGVEPFDEDNPKCQQLRAALTLPCVRQITTRDDLGSTQRYVEGTDIPVALVSDPAVFADLVFATPRRRAPKPALPYRVRSLRDVRALLGKARRRVRRLARERLDPRSAPVLVTPRRSPTTTPATTAPPARKKKAPRVGLVVTRAKLAKDNRINFSGADQDALWLEVMELLAERGYDYTLLTTGHFSDEVFLDHIVRKHAIPAKNVVLPVNSPEELIGTLASCDGVLAYRLHASITCFSYQVPSVGLSWNFKVPDFYASAGHPERALPPERWTAPDLVAALEKAMSEGVTRDVPFMMSVYETLFSGIKGVLRPDSEATAYTYEELRKTMPRYGGTSEAEYRGKVKRKLRRAYQSYAKWNKQT